MSETETSVPMDDKALFEGAIEAPAPAEAAPTEHVDAGPARDEAGRFAPKAEPAPAEAAPEPAIEKPVEARQEPPPGWIPAWRAREIADAKTQRLEAELRKYTEKPQDPIDPYVDPEKFRDVGVRQAVDPIQRQMAETREYYSRKDAIRTHGAETVQAAYQWVQQAANAGDPRVAALVSRITTSIDPFEEVVTAYKRDKALDTVGDDPNAWFDKELERRKADPEFVSKHLTPAQAQSDPKTNIIRMPPSLNRQTGSAAAATGTMTDADLYTHATS